MVDLAKQAEGRESEVSVRERESERNSLLSCSNTLFTVVDYFLSLLLLLLLQSLSLMLLHFVFCFFFVVVLYDFSHLLLFRLHNPYYHSHIFSTHIFLSSISPAPPCSTSFRLWAIIFLNLTCLPLLRAEREWEVCPSVRVHYYVCFCVCSFVCLSVYVRLKFVV